MASSSRDRWILGALAALLAGCSIGQGDGEIGGTLVATDFCGVDDPSYELHPSFYSGEVTGDSMNLRIQRGSDLEGFADGLVIHLRDVNEIEGQRIGLPIAISDEETALAQVVFYANETCPSGFPDEFRERPVIFEASGGTITFTSIYAPEGNPGSTLIEASIEGATFADPELPEERHASLDGWFSFFYQRGAPAQRFP